MSNSSSRFQPPTDDPLPWFMRKPAIVAWVSLAVLLLALIFNPYTRVTTEAGTLTVVTDTPLFFGEGGVRPMPLTPGAEWIWKTTTLEVVDPKPQVIPIVINDFVSKDNILLDFESAVAIQVTDWPKMVSKFGNLWWKNNLERPYIAMVREQVKQYSMKELMSDTVTANKVDDKITEVLISKVAQLGLPVRIIEINLGRAKPNPEILKQMDATATQQQRLLTLEQARLAEEKRTEEQIAKAKADNAYRNNIGLNVGEFVQLQLADKAIEACAAAKECVILPPGTPAVVGK